MPDDQEAGEASTLVTRGRGEIECRHKARSHEATSATNDYPNGTASLPILGTRVIPVVPVDLVVLASRFTASNMNLFKAYTKVSAVFASLSVPSTRDRG